MRERTRRDASAAEVAEVLTRPGERFVVTSHHNPDGDAIGSMLGLARALRAAGADVALAHADVPAVPGDLAFLPTAGEAIAPAPPDDVAERVLVAVDCASELRMWHEPVHERARLVVNIDHHQDNTRFGDLNLIEPAASSTAEVLFGVLEEAGLPVTREVAEPLYVGLVTDTGRFGYTNTSPRSHRIAAAMLEAGVDPSAMSRRLYEEQPLDRLLLMGRALERARPLAGGRVLAAVLTADDFSAAGGDDTEGIVETMRGVRGVAAAALVRQAGPAGSWRVSLRTVDPAVDVSAIAREEGGGGHRAAAGFSTRRAPEDLLAWLDERMAQRLDANGAGA
ncbi:DHH family phosphoesterase [Miltoncostaea marina]|uniref:DHH family phosphoesterase n=1 Tax=Miltoncostaea marina TaxID=2843215 RepID=UPI001C3D0586|nr:DHH family phosphoesterase [Miltoncostaea marina]